MLWKRPDGRPVTRGVLSDTSRALLGQLLADQGFNVVLSTANFCGLGGALARRTGAARRGAMKRTGG